MSGLEIAAAPAAIAAPRSPFVRWDEALASLALVLMTLVPLIEIAARMLIDSLPLDGGNRFATNACRRLGHLRRGTKSKAANELALVLVVASW